MGQQVKPGYGQSDSRPELQARKSGWNLIRECHKGQLANSQHEQAECKAANPLNLHAADSCFPGDVHARSD